MVCSWNPEYFRSLAKLTLTVWASLTLQETRSIHDSVNIPKFEMNLFTVPVRLFCASLFVLLYFNILPQIDAVFRFCKQSRPRSGSSYKSCLILVYYVCLWKHDISDPTLVDLTSYFFVLCTSMKA